MISNALNDIDGDWENFLEDGSIKNTEFEKSINKLGIPKCSDLYISTKTKILYLSSSIDLAEVFWKIPLIKFHRYADGIVKKQMKFNFFDEASLELITNKLKNEKNVDEQIISRIKNPDARIKFRDIRKISIGICSKDILNKRSKKKSAFYNCFVIIARVFHIDRYREVHVKIFNTGKVEIPGIQSEDCLKKTMDLIMKTFIPLLGTNNLSFDLQKTETVLINSNFNCGFYINRDILFETLKFKYKINCIYDPCSYPGIQCKYVYKNTKISFMIFRTGSVLIVGKCEDDILNEIYEFVKRILTDEYESIFISNIENGESKKKTTKMNKRQIQFDGHDIVFGSESGDSCSHFHTP